MIDRRAPSGREVAIDLVGEASDSSEKWIPLFGPMLSPAPAASRGNGLILS